MLGKQNEEVKPEDCSTNVTYEPPSPEKELQRDILGDIPAAVVHSVTTFLEESAAGCSDWVLEKQKSGATVYTREQHGANAPEIQVQQ